MNINLANYRLTIPDDVTPRRREELETALAVAFIRRHFEDITPTTAAAVLELEDKDLGRKLGVSDPGWLKRLREMSLEVLRMAAATAEARGEI